MKRAIPRTASRAHQAHMSLGYEADVGSNVVDAVIHTLRKKLGGKASMIETVRGVGYRFR